MTCIDLRIGWWKTTYIACTLTLYKMCKEIPAQRNILDVVGTWWNMYCIILQDMIQSKTGHLQYLFKQSVFLCLALELHGPLVNSERLKKERSRQSFKIGALVATETNEKRVGSGWWFQICFNFHFYLGKIPILTHIFQMAWTSWNHQLVVGRNPSFHIVMFFILTNGCIMVYLQFPVSFRVIVDFHDCDKE